MKKTIKGMFLKNYYSLMNKLTFNQVNYNSLGQKHGYYRIKTNLGFREGEYKDNYKHGKWVLYRGVEVRNYFNYIRGRKYGKFMDHSQNFIVIGEYINDELEGKCQFINKETKILEFIIHYNKGVSLYEISTPYGSTRIKNFIF